MSDKDSAALSPSSKPDKKKTTELTITGQDSSGLIFDDPEVKFPSSYVPEPVGVGSCIELTLKVVSPQPFKEWAKAYVAQGESDLKVYRELKKLRIEKKIEECHELHYLQMALEKIAKGFILAHQQQGRSQLMGDHKTVKTFFTVFVKYKDFFEGRIEWVDEVKKLASGIELLTPAVDKNNFPANVEYPWPDKGKLVVPSENDFLTGLSQEPKVWEFLLEALEEAVKKTNAKVSESAS